MRRFAIAGREVGAHGWPDVRLGDAQMGGANASDLVAWLANAQVGYECIIVP